MAKNTDLAGKLIFKRSLKKGGNPWDGRFRHAAFGNDVSLNNRMSVIYLFYIDAKFRYLHKCILKSKYSSLPNAASAKFPCGEFHGIGRA